MNYTKGEWKAKDKSYFQGEMPFIVSPTYSSYVIARVDNEANAHLIAAAPELYEACNKMWSYLISRPAKPKELTDILLLCEKGLAKTDTK